MIKCRISLQDNKNISFFNYFYRIIRRMLNKKTIFAAIFGALQTYGYFTGLS